MCLQLGQLGERLGPGALHEPDRVRPGGHQDHHVDPELAATPAPNLTGYPNSMAAFGDSIRAYNTGTLPFGDAPGNSWSTGTRSSIESHYLRILDAEPAIFERSLNDAVSGAKMADLASQVATANEQQVAYVTILIGANDLCTGSVDGMTSVDGFRTQFEAAKAALTAGSPRARIYVARIPNVYRPWVILKDDPLARATWSTFDICQSLLDDPRSTDADDVAPRTFKISGQSSAGSSAT